jgi:hypothetical protein
LIININLIFYFNPIMFSGNNGETHPINRHIPNNNYPNQEDIAVGIAHDDIPGNIMIDPNFIRTTSK